MTYKSEHEAQAKELWKQGQTVTAIARWCAVDRKTIQRWMKSWSPEELDRGEPGDPGTNHRIWPGWSIEDLKDLPGFVPAEWELNIILISMAQKDGDGLTPWFFRRLVEFGKDNPEYPKKHMNWAFAVAGLPPIGAWLGDNGECEALSEAIKRHKPWEWRRGAFERPKNTGFARRAYQKDAHDLTESIRQRIRVVSALRVQRDLRAETNPIANTATLLIAAFHERIPLFDHVRRRSTFKKFDLAQIVLGVLATKESTNVA